MRPNAFAGLVLTLLLPLCGCGNTWWNPPLTGGFSPNQPVGDSDNLRRVMGQDAPTEELKSEPGDIWPGPLPPAPTLRDLDARAGADPAFDRPSSDRSGATAMPAARGGASPTPR